MGTPRDEEIRFLAKQLFVARGGIQALKSWVDAVEFLDFCDEAQWRRVSVREEKAEAAKALAMAQGESAAARALRVKDPEPRHVPEPPRSVYVDVKT